MVFRIVLSLLADHKDMLLQCRNMEQLMDYFKTTLPSMGASQLERVIRQVLAVANNCIHNDMIIIIRLVWCDAVGD